MRIFKSEPSADLLDRQLRFLEASGCGPTGIQRQSAYAYTYDFMGGWHPHGYQDWCAAWRFCNQNLWNKPALDGDWRTASEYADYLVTRGASVTLCNEIAQIKYEACLCHGDLTGENMVMRPGGSLCLIDPGMPWLPCQEQDEAKMLQSILLGWKHPSLISVPFVVSRTHKLLLYGHVIRLLHHREKHKQRDLDYMQIRCNDLEAELL